MNINDISSPKQPLQAPSPATDNPSTSITEIEAPTPMTINTDPPSELPSKACSNFL